MTNSPIPVSELRACPFCGRDGACHEDEGDGYGRVICTCTAYGPLRSSEAEAIAAWNTRALDPVLAENERLRRLLGHARHHVVFTIDVDAQAGDLANEIDAALRSITAEPGE